MRLADEGSAQRTRRLRCKWQACVLWSLPTAMGWFLVSRHTVFMDIFDCINGTAIIPTTIRSKRHRHRCKNVAILAKV